MSAQTVRHASTYIILYVITAQNTSNANNSHTICTACVILGLRVFVCSKYVTIMLLVPLSFHMWVVFLWGVILGICVLNSSCADEKTSKPPTKGDVEISMGTNYKVSEKVVTTIQSPVWLRYFERSTDLLTIYLMINVSVTHIPAWAFAIWPETQVGYNDVMIWKRFPHFVPLWGVSTGHQWFPSEGITMMWHLLLDCTSCWTNRRITGDLIAMTLLRYYCNAHLICRLQHRK